MSEYIFNDDTSKIKPKPRPKPKIIPIKILDDKLEYLNKKLHDTKILPYQKRELITKITGGLCSIGRETPTKIASYDMGGWNNVNRKIL